MPLLAHPTFPTVNGRRKFAVLPYREFVALQERLEEMEDLLELRKAKKAESHKLGIPLAEVIRRLGLKP
jgi:hypothetical protein